MLFRSLELRGFDPYVRSDAAEALLALEADAFDVVLSDLNMRGRSGLELCERIVGTHPDLPVIILTAFGTLQTAVGAIRAGAYDFLTKPIDLDVLTLSLQRAARHSALAREVDRLRRAVGAPRAFEGFSALGGPRLRQPFALCCF